jgi:hypothetical protein
VADGDAAPVAADAAAGAGLQADSAAMDGRVDSEPRAAEQVDSGAPLESPVVGRVSGPAAGPEPTKYLQ